MESSHGPRLRILTSIILILVFSYTTEAHPVNNPGLFSVTRIANFPFYQKIVNPCGLSIGVPTESSSPSESLAATVFTDDFVTDMGVAINLTIDSLDDLEKAIEHVSVSCDGVALVSLPPPPNLQHMSDLRMMSGLYKSGIFLIAHLHLVTLDRTTADDSFGESGNEIHGQQGSFLCENEPTNYVSLVEELTRRLENLVCTVISGANLEQRASFRRPLESLELTKLFRYHGTCTALQTRDCVVFRQARRALGNYRKKFTQLRHELNRLLQAARENLLEIESLHSLAGRHFQEVDNNL